MTIGSTIHDGLAPELAVELLTKILSAEQVSTYCYRSDHRAPDAYYVYFPLGSKMIFGCVLRPWAGAPDFPLLDPQNWTYDALDEESRDCEDYPTLLVEAIDDALVQWATERFGAAPDFEIVIK